MFGKTKQNGSGASKKTSTTHRSNSNVEAGKSATTKHSRNSGMEAGKSTTARNCGSKSNNTTSLKNK